MQLNKNRRSAGALAEEDKITCSNILNRRPRLRMFSPGLWPGLLLKKPLKSPRGENRRIPSCFLRKTALFEKLFSRNKANFEKLKINTSTCKRNTYSNLPPKPTKPQSQLKPIFSPKAPRCGFIQKTQNPIIYSYGRDMPINFNNTKKKLVISQILHRLNWLL